MTRVLVGAPETVNDQTQLPTTRRDEIQSPSIRVSSKSTHSSSNLEVPKDKRVENSKDRFQNRKILLQLVHDGVEKRSSQHQLNGDLASCSNFSFRATDIVPLDRT